MVLLHETPRGIHQDSWGASHGGHAERLGARVLDIDGLYVYISYMSAARPKPSVRKAAKASSATDRARFRSLAPEPLVALQKGERGGMLRKVPLPDRLLKALGPFVTVSIADARTLMPKMVRSSAVGHTYLISNARTADAPSAVLIGLEELNRVVAEPVNTRTLGEVLASLPFSGMELKPLTAGILPGSGLPAVLLPK